MSNHLKSTGELLVLVDIYGRQIGTEEKLLAHQNGDLHSAFSLMIVRPSATGFEYLLQRRAASKYHSGGLWSNTCCSHPRPNEDLSFAVQRRVKEELGLSDKLDLITLAPIIYRAQLDNGLIEHEFDHIFLAIAEHPSMNLNPDEVSEIKWLDEHLLYEQLATSGDQFTAWFDKVFHSVKNYLNDVSSAKLTEK